MISISSKCVRAAVVSLALLAAPAFAWSPKSTVAKLSFDFVVNGQTLPAGEYQFEMPTAAGVMAVRDAKGKVIFAVVDKIGTTHAKPNPQLVFNKAKGAYTLSEVWMASEGGGYVIKSK